MQTKLSKPKPPCDEETVAKLTMLLSIFHTAAANLQPNFLPNQKLSTKPKTFHQTKNFLPNQKLSTKPKAFHQTKQMNFKIKESRCDGRPMSDVAGQRKRRNSILTFPFGDTHRCYNSTYPYTVNLIKKVLKFIYQLALGIFGGLKRTLVQIYTLVSQNRLCGNYALFVARRGMSNLLAFLGS